MRRPSRWLAIVVIGAALLATDVQATRGAGPQQPKPSAPVVIEDGFHWKDAGVGAAAALAIVTIAAGLVLVVRDQPASRERKPRGEERA